MVVEESLVEESVIFVRVAAIARRVSRSHCAPSAVLEAASRRSRRRRVAFTTRSLRGVRSLVARARARWRRKRLPVSSLRISCTSGAWSLMGPRRSKGNKLFRNMSFETESSRYLAFGPWRAVAVGDEAARLRPTRVWRWKVRGVPGEPAVAWEAEPQRWRQGVPGAWLW